MALRYSTWAESGVQRAARCAVAAAASLALAETLRLPFPQFAFIAAVMVMDPSPAETRRLTIPRFAGTGIGAALGALLSPVLPAGPIAVAVGIFGTMIISHALRMPDAAKLAGYVCALSMLQPSAPLSYSWWRFVETVLGIAVALLVSLVPPLLPPPARNTP